MRFLNRYFEMEEINGHERCPTYMYRWTLFNNKRFRNIGKIYLHKFVGDDWTRDLHDHPKRFISLGLWGCYVEETPNGERFYTAPWLRTFPAMHIHRLRLAGSRKATWTLVIVLRAVRPWGFWHLGSWIPWRDYVDSEDAGRMKNCP